MTQKILICNNNNKILENIKSLLEDSNFKYDLANSYEVLNQLAKKQTSKADPYSVIITDLNVNKENGSDILADIAKTNLNSTIIAIYSYADFSIEKLDSEIKDNKNILFLKKPFEDIEFIQLIKHSLNKATSNIEEPVTCDIMSSNKELLDNISHELRTPLASIVGIAEILQSTKLNDEQMKHVKSIFRCSDSLLSIISDMIDFENVKDKKIELYPTDFNFTDLIEGCVNLVSKQAMDKDVDVNLSISSDVPTFIHSDERKIRKLVWNLITNAVKYTNYGNVSVFCNYKRANDTNMLTIAIKDTGIGIDKKTISKLFSQFESSDNPYNSGGSGIGLAITNHLVKAFNGKIDVDSMVDHGSTFTITIPVETVLDKSLQLQFGSFTPLNNTKGMFISLNRDTAEAIIPQFEKQNCVLEHAETIRGARTILQHRDEPIKWCVFDDSVMNAENAPLLKNLLLTCKQHTVKPLIIAKHQYTIDFAQKLGIYNSLNKPCLERDIRKVLSYHSDMSTKTNFAPSLIPVDKIRKQKILNVLIAEDNEINRMVLSDMIRRNGHKFDIAKHGKIAVDKTVMNKYDLILMDVQMPIMNGLEATKHIRLEDKNTPIIAMTANIAEHTKQECILAGMNDYLTKPINEKTLTRLLEKYSK